MENNKLEVVQKQVSPIVKQAKAIEIKVKDDMISATDVLSKLNKWNDSLIEDRERITKPLNEALKEVRGKYKPLEKSLEEAIELIRDKMSEFQTREMKRIADEENKIADRIRMGKGGLRFETAMKKIDEIERVDSKIEGENGGVKFRTDKVLKIVNVDLIPDKYYDLNESMVLKDLKAGVEVAGAVLEDKLVVINSR